MTDAHDADETTIVAAADLLGKPRRLGPYELRSELGRGGMGVVYRAYHHSLRRDCAIKMLLGSDPTVAERFVLEGQAAARLGKHRNIVQVFDAGVIDGTAYIAMEFVEGEPLDTLIARRGPLPEAEVLELTRRIAMALGHAHGKGIVHRDMKPGNVIVDPEGEPNILDFGLAKDLAVADSALSTSGNIIGTPNYMPPEQADPAFGSVDRRSDVYSLGATMHHALSGGMPFRAENVVDTIVQVLSREPDRFSSKLKVSRDTEAIVFKAMEKRKRHRYQTALGLADDVARVIAGEPPQARRVGPINRLVRRVRRHPLIAILVLFLMVFAAVASAYVTYREGETRALWSRAYEQIATATAEKTRTMLEPAIPLLQECRALARDGLLPVDTPDELVLHLNARFRYRGLDWLSYGDAKKRFSGVWRRDDGAIILNQSAPAADGTIRLREDELLEHGERRLVREKADHGYDPTEQPWYQLATRNDEPVWLKPYPWYGQGYGITLTVADRSRSGGMRGAFTADFRLIAISRFLAEHLELGEGARAFLLTQDKTVIARSDLAADDAGHPVLSAALGAQDGIDLTTLKRDTPESTEVEVDGVEWVVAAKLFEIEGGLRWAVAVAVPAATVRGDVDAITRLLLILGLALASLIIMALVGLFLRTRASARRRKRRATRKVARPKVR